MKALYFFAVALIVSYLATTIFTFGVPKSISDTHYLWKSKGWSYLFTFVMWFTGVPVLIYWVYVSPEKLQFIPFLSISGMCFVGAACAFKEHLTAAVHYTSAGVWASFAVLYFILVHDWIAISAGVVTFILMALFIGRKHFTFWAEIACVITMIIGIYNL
jgi:hypothetical protein